MAFSGAGLVGDTILVRTRLLRAEERAALRARMVTAGGDGEEDARLRMCSWCDRYGNAEVFALYIAI